MGFVGNYAPHGLTPQIQNMPVILIKKRDPVWISLNFINICFNHLISCSVEQADRIDLLSILF